MGFVALDEVKPLDYDLRDSAGNGPTGVVPEPTDKQMRRFRADLVALAKDAAAEDDKTKDVDPDDPAAIAEALGDLTEDELKVYDDRTNDILARICGGKQKSDGTWTGGSPTHAQLENLSSRYRQAFTGWLLGELNPEAASGEPNK